MLEFNLIGNIGSDITPQLINSYLAEANGEDITFYIASLGGSLSDGRTIYGLIKNYKGKTRGVIIGDTASAGTVAILGCNTVDCDSNSPFLIHNSWDPEGGNASELRKKAVNLERQDKTMISIYKDKTGLPEAKIIELMAKEDWLLPTEAKQYGFIDNIIEAKYKVAAYIAQPGQISNELLTKLKNKMGLFNKKNEKNYPLALKDGNMLVINAEEVAANVEVMPLGAMTLEDGEYELSDGRMIVISGGMITEVKEVGDPAATGGEAETEAIVEAVSEVVVAEIDKIRAEFDEKLGKISSKHQPPKSKETNPGQKGAQASVKSSVKEITDGIRQKIVESRKA